ERPAPIRGGVALAAASALAVGVVLALPAWGCVGWHLRILLGAAAGASWTTIAAAMLRRRSWLAAVVVPCAGIVASRLVVEAVSECAYLSIWSGTAEVVGAVAGGAVVVGYLLAPRQRVAGTVAAAAAALVLWVGWCWWQPRYGSNRDLDGTPVTFSWLP